MLHSSSATSVIDWDRIVGQSPFIHQLKARLARLAPTNTSVLITGETGTGKELVAELLHRKGPRRARNFVCINCAAIPDELLESELFGYERGAFTGAHAMKEGKLKLADGGTVFLDEVGDMSLCAQAKVLRALESRRVERLGGQTTVDLDVRVISATNQDLEQLVAEGRFRKDLYFRLNVARIQLPPLRDRKCDLRPLAESFLSEFESQFGSDTLELEPEAWDAMLQYDWPGNIRELRNVIETLYATAASRRISRLELPEPLLRSACRFESSSTCDAELKLLLDTLCSVQWNKAEAARALGWSRMRIYRKIAKYRIQCPATVNAAVTVL